MPYDVDSVRSRFPALGVADDGRPRIYFDNPAGTQVPQTVIDRMSDCLIRANANLGGGFRSSELADEVVAEARAAMADFLNAETDDEIVFGQNMTTITLHVSRSIGRALAPGDEIIVSRMDHDANVTPWVLMARDHDLVVRSLPFDTTTFEFDLDALDELLTERTRLVCVGGASNLIGTINDVAEISRRAHDAGAWTYVDAVQSAPHIATDVQTIGCDFLVCSAYKFFGPHQGILWGRREVLESLQPYKVRPAPDELPWSYETGTQSHEGMAGTAAAIDHFAWIGTAMADGESSRWAHLDGRRRDVHKALDCLFDYERGLTEHLVDGLKALPGTRVLGITDPDAFARRVPTVAFTHASHDPGSIARQLGERGIFVWSGHNYAIEVADALGILESGGAVRVGPVHYNTHAEIDALLNALEDVLGATPGRRRA